MPVSLFRLTSSPLSLHIKHRCRAQRNPARRPHCTAPGQEAQPAVSLPKAGRFAAAMFAAGAAFGPPLDGIHSTVHLLVYDKGAVTLGTLHTSTWVFLLLGAFYAVLGGLHVSLDSWAQERDGGKTLQLKNKLSVPNVALSFGVLALLLESSSSMYVNGVPYSQISLALALLAAANWTIFEGTYQGIGLALLCAISAPLSEIVIMQQFGLWHYLHPDVFGEFGFPSWVPWCYFFYTPALGNLARLVWKKI